MVRTMGSEIKTPLCDLLGIEYPVIQGGMAWVADAQLAAAVSEAGGLGIIAAMNSNKEQLRAEVIRARELTDKPFGVNIMMMSPFVAEVAEVVIEEKVPIVTTGAGNPGPYMKAWTKAGIKVVPVIASCAMAKRVVRDGACAVVAEGTEAGGHIGEITTMSLVPQICDTVDVPVIAAGGIADGRGMAAALMLGAQGIQMGTRFLVANECTIHPTYKAKVLKANDLSTAATGKRLGHPIRSLRTPFTRELLELEYDSTVSDGVLKGKGIGALRRAVKDGDEKEGCFMAGQAAALVKEEQSASEIIRDVCDGAKDAINTATQWIHGR